MKRNILFFVALVMVVAAWGTGCGGQATPVAAPLEAVTPPQMGSADREPASRGIIVPTSEVGTQEGVAKTLTSAPEPTPPGILAGGEEAVRLAVQDLEDRLGVVPETIRVVTVAAVEWTDASLGCPQPGMAYAQVITPGFLVVLSVNGQEYEYHTHTQGFAMLCEEEASGTVPSKGKRPDVSVQDGWPNETRDYDVTIVPPTERK